MRTKKSMPLKFTKGTNPFEKDIISFVIAENIQCPINLPMLMQDADMTALTLHAASNNSNVPISEYIKKEFFYRCYMGFSKAFGGDPALIGYEVQRICRKYDY